jgi:hypothetical protein
MRNIKFRGRDNNGQWHIGFLANVDDEPAIFEMKIGWIDGIELSGIFDYVQEDTIGQFTSLIDSKGADIYEGDIIHVSGSDEVEDGNYLVKWSNMSTGFVLIDLLVLKFNYAKMQSRFENL